MAPLLFREIKGINFSCSSPSSAATCSSIHQRSIIQPVSTGREIDRHTPRLSDPQRIVTRQPLLISNSKPRTRKSSAEQADLVDLADSSRCLLESTRLGLEDAPAFYDIFPDSRTIAPPLLSTETSRFQRIRSSELAVLRPSASTRTQDQVVDLRVSLHCKGCEGKVRRHIAKMQGVRSFNVDLAKKKVTVVGDVTPLGVLNSISKVKHAQFWQSPPRASASF